VRPRKTVLAALATGLCLSIGGCGQQPSTVQPGAQPGGEAEGPGVTKSEAERLDAAAHWADGYCVAVSELVKTLSTMPVVDPSSEKRAFASSSQLLGSLAGGLDHTLTNLKNLPTSPVVGGDGVRETAIGKYTGVRDRTLAAKQRLDATGPNSPQSKEALTAASGPLDEISKLNLLDGFDSVPELAGAGDRAPTCRQLTEHGGPAASLNPGGKPAG
jgi:hypothetical protein